MAEKREDDLLDDAEHVRLEKLPGMRVFDGVVQIVDRLLQNARRHVTFLFVLVKDFQKDLFVGYRGGGEGNGADNGEEGSKSYSSSNKKYNSPGGDTETSNVHTTYYLSNKPQLT